MCPVNVKYLFVNDIANVIMRLSWMQTLFNLTYYWIISAYKSNDRQIYTSTLSKQQIHFTINSYIKSFIWLDADDSGIAH